MTTRSTVRGLTRTIANGAGGRRDVSLPSFATGSKLIIVGDSIAQQNHFATSSKVSSRNNGWIEWALARLPGFQNVIWYDATATGGSAPPLFRGANFGQSGDTAPQVAARTTPMVNTGADVAVVLAGTNTGGDATVPTATAALQDILDDLTGAGMYVILCTIWPRDVVASPTGSQISPALNTRRESINDWIRGKDSAMVKVLDVESVLKDPSPISPLLDGSPIPELYYDEVHPAAKGAKAAGDVLYDFLKQTIANDIYSSTWFNADPTDSANRLLDGD
jgi:lysophospholipase L1-like esterase